MVVLDQDSYVFWLSLLIQVCWTLLLLSLPTQQASKRTYTYVSIWQSKQIGL